MPSTFSRSMASLQADSFRRSRAVILASLVLLILWFVWFFGAQVTLTQVSVQGRLEVSREAHDVQAPVAGRVVTSYLVLGRTVLQGDLLVELDSTTETLKLAEQRATLAAQQAQLGSLQEVIAAEERARRANLAEGTTAVQEAEARRHEEDVAVRYSLDKVSRLLRLKQGGHLAEMDYLLARSEAEKGGAMVDRLRVSVSRLRKAQDATESDRQAALAKLRRVQVTLQGTIATSEAAIRRLLHEIERRRIRAPLAGRLAQLAAIRVGSYLEEGKDLCTVVPPGKLKVVGYFQPEAMGKVRTGQKARLRLEGFSWTQYGSLRADVTRVAGELERGLLRVELSPGPGTSPAIPLQHGLPGTVEVETERISPALLLLRTAGRIVTDPPATASNSASRGDAQ